MSPLLASVEVVKMRPKCNWRSQSSVSIRFRFFNKIYRGYHCVVDRDKWYVKNDIIMNADLPFWLFPSSFFISFLQFLKWIEIFVTGRWLIILNGFIHNIICAKFSSTCTMLKKQGQAILIVHLDTTIDSDRLQSTSSMKNNLINICRM